MFVVPITEQEKVTRLIFILDSIYFHRPELIYIYMYMCMCVYNLEKKATMGTVCVLGVEFK